MRSATDDDLEASDGSGEPAALTGEIRRHLLSTLGTDSRSPNAFRAYLALAHVVRDRLIEQWIATQRSYYQRRAKRVYYLSLEFLPGRLLLTNLTCLGLVDRAREALGELGFTLEQVAEQELEAGLGNGGLGRLASCYLDSLATLGLAAHGYGIRYDYGIFYQWIRDGWQVERPDNWLRAGNPWEFLRPEHLYEVSFGGQVVSRTDAEGRPCFDWVGTSNVMAMACDILIPGHRNGHALNMRLWSARSSRELELEPFNSGDYFHAVEDKIRSENISRVLYPSETARQGRELRLQQEYFFVCATFQDIMRRFRKGGAPITALPDLVAVQLNDTHPAIGVAELMRLLVDGERLPWETAWDLCVRTFGYTNHTVMPEALEHWPVEMLGRMLPRHLQIILEINRRFLAAVELSHPGDPDRLRRLSLIEEAGERSVRMANLAAVGSHAVNGVSALHGRLLREEVLADLAALHPERFTSITNGVDHRRFLLQANPALAALITGAIGGDWITRPEALAALGPLASEEELRRRWRLVKQENKQRLADCLRERWGIEIDPAAMLDVHVKRFHEYKRQLLNVLHVIVQLGRLRRDAAAGAVPRTVIFAGKAAPAYFQAKLIIKLIHCVADAIQRDPATKGRLRVAFVPNYDVTLAERLAPATDLSQQISTAGTEASGTGVMKAALNGALVIGTLDGANLEIAAAAGAGNLFAFGASVEELRRRRASGYDPRAVVATDGELAEALRLLAEGAFSPDEPDLFRGLVAGLLDADPYHVVGDFRAYEACQREVEAAYRDEEGWTRRAIRTVAGMGHFSSDRAVREYAERIWGLA